MDQTLELRVASMERSNRRSRLALIATMVALGGSIMLGLKDGDDVETIDGFTAAFDSNNALSYFRLVNKDEVQILDTSRGDRWFWRRIRNWPDAK